MLRFFIPSLTKAIRSISSLPHYGIITKATDPPTREFSGCNKQKQVFILFGTSNGFICHAFGKIQKKPHGDVRHSFYNNIWCVIVTLLQIIFNFN